MDLDRLHKIKDLTLFLRKRCPGGYPSTNGVDIVACEHHLKHSHDLGPCDPDKVWIIEELETALTRIEFLEARHTEFQELGTKHINIIRELKAQLEKQCGNSND